MFCDSFQVFYALGLVTPIFGLGDSVFSGVFNAYEAENGRVGLPRVAGAC